MKLLIGLFFVLFWQLNEVFSLEKSVESLGGDYIKETFFASIKDDQSSLCQIQLSYMAKNYKTLKMFASELYIRIPYLVISKLLILVVDSWGKLPSGILMGNVFEIGNFDECVDFHMDLPKPIGTIEGQYCKAFLKTSTGNEMSESDLSKIFTSKSRAQPSLTIGSGICIPKSCDVTVLKEILKDIPLSIMGCQTNDPAELEAIDFVTM